MLTCQFDLAQDRLYSVKWYKAGREFYRFVPAENPRKQDFPFTGVTVDVSIRWMGKNEEGWGRMGKDGEGWGRIGRGEGRKVRKVR